jgi:hypothetical protein
MTGMNPLRERRWPTIAVLVAVFFGALSMHMERVMGWAVLVLCFIAGSVGGLSYVWGRERFALYWNKLPKSKRRIAVATALALYITANLIANHRKPDEGFRDAMTCLLVLGGLSLWGLYRIVSRFLDALHERLSRR